MGFSIYQNGFCCHLRPDFQMNRGLVCTARLEPSTLRRRVLRTVDNELAKGNKKRALSLVKQLQGKPGGLRGFGAAKQVPHRHYTLDGLNLNETEMASLQTLMDSILDSVDKSFQMVAFEMASSAEEMESLMSKNTETDLSSSEDYHNMCKQHEAGHFLIAYLIGVLPERYIIPRMEDMEDELVGGRVDCVGLDFLNSVSVKTLPKIKGGKVCATVNRAKVSIKNMNRFSCITLAGLAAECHAFGYSEGSFGDIIKLDELFRWLGYTENEVQCQVRWAVLNTALLSRRHCDARSKLADAMSSGKSIGYCIETIENALDGKEI